MIKRKIEKQALIIQPGAVGDGILTIPLARLLRQYAGIDSIDIMGHPEKLAYLKGRTELDEVISLEAVPLHRLFTDSNTFDLSEGDELIELLRPYDVIISFLGDEEGHFEKNLIFTTAFTHTADVIMLPIKPPADYPGHAARFFLEQCINQILPGIIFDEHAPADIYGRIYGRGAKRAFPGLFTAQVSLIDEVIKTPLIRTTALEIEAGRSVLRGFGIESAGNLIVLHPGSGGVHKCWPLKEFQSLVSMLSRLEYQPVFLLGPVEQDTWVAQTLEELNSQTPLLHNLSLEQVTQVLSCCSGYVGNDSGITHLAGAVGAPAVAIFGPSNPRHWQPLGQKVKLAHKPFASDDFRVSSQPADTWPDAGEVLELLMGLIQEK